MKFHNITMVGKFLLQKLTSLPVFSAADEGRIVYNSTNKKSYLATDTRFKKLGSGAWGDLTSTFTSGGTLSDGYLYSIDTSASSLTGYLDASPTDGDIVSVYDEFGTFATNNFIIDGNGNTINGNTTLTFATDDTIASLVYESTEWKADIGGLSSVSPSGNINFASIAEVTTMESADKFVMSDDTDGFNKKLTLSNWFTNLNVDDNLAVLASADDADYFIVYDVDAGVTKKILSSNVVDNATQLNKIDIKANDMFLDDTLTGISYGSVFDMYKTIDFSTSADGACWLFGKFPTNWSTSTDLQLNINYSLNGNDPSKTVRLVVDFWSVSEEDTPVAATSDVTINNDITTAATNIGKYTEDALTAVGNAYLDSGIKSFVIEITRDVSEDAYSGELQLISVDVYQS